MPEHHFFIYQGFKVEEEKLKPELENLWTISSLEITVEVSGFQPRDLDNAAFLMNRTQDNSWTQYEQ